MSALLPQHSSSISLICFQFLPHLMLQLSLLLSKLSFFFWGGGAFYLQILTLSHSGDWSLNPACTLPFLFLVMQQPRTGTNCAAHYCTEEITMIMCFLFMSPGRVICSPLLSASGPATSAILFTVLFKPSDPYLLPALCFYYTQS